MNTFGNCYRLTTFGESHGQAVGGIIDGCPPGLAIDITFVNKELSRRKCGHYSSQRHEADEIEWLSGIVDGISLGTPIAFSIRNRDTRSEDYASFGAYYRPGHADYSWECRYGIRDTRGGGRASARETVARVVGGAIAKIFLTKKNILISSRIQTSPTPNENDSAGGIIEGRIEHLGAGYGTPIFGKLNARLAAAMMSIPSAIGFEIGAGFAASTMTGGEFADQWNADFSTQTNHCGGIQGGISNGMPIIFRTAFHPVVSIGKPVDCIDRNGELHTIQLGGRHDKSHIQRTAVIVEAMTAMTIADVLLQQDCEKNISQYEKDK